MNGQKQRILITGASGFIGSFLCEEALNHGFETWAAMRTHSSRKWLQDTRLQFITLDLTDKSVLREQLKDTYFDIIIHAGGATKCLNQEDFDFHNFQCTKNFVEVLTELGCLPKQFVYLSSLSAIYGSTYGNSKLKSEAWLKEHQLPLVIFRPTGVYGPREKDYFMMAKSIKKHIDFAVGMKEQILTFVYVKDLTGAIFAAIDRNITDGQIFNVTDGQEYESRTFSDLIQKELAVKHVIHIKAPLWLLKIVSCIAEDLSKITGKPATLNRDKYKIMAQRDWTCDITPLRQILNYEPQWQLERGVKETMEWYKNEGWI